MRTVTAALVLLLGLAGCCAPPPPAAEAADRAPRGAGATTDYFDAERSAIRPQRRLERPGATRGRFLPGGGVCNLAVRPVAPPFGDDFILRVGQLERPFHAAYQRFAIAAADLDGDGQDEIVLESGWGRGTNVYTPTLEIARHDGARLRTLFRTTLGGWFMARDGSLHHWTQRYAFPRAGEMVLALVEAPSVEPWDAETRARLRYARRAYVYNRALDAYALTDLDERALE